MFGIKISNNEEIDIETSVKTSLHVQKFHEKLGHSGDNITRMTAKNLGLKLHGTLKQCDGCMLGKMRQKNVPKQKGPNAKEAGQCFFLDISSIKYRSIGGAKFLAMFMDDYSGFLIGFYLKQKSDLAEKGIEVLQKN